MPWKEIRVENWEALTKELDHFGTLPPLEQRVVFRGQADAGWQLIPSICRRAAEGETPMTMIELEDMARREFSSQAHLHFPKGILPTEDSSILPWWFLMQQYGAPTRLIDWSTSPYVAAYFAVEDKWSRSGAIWCYDQYQVNTYMLSQHGDLFEDAIGGHVDQLLTEPDPPEILFTITRFLKNDRMVAQQGLSTLCTSMFSKHDEVIEKAFSKPSAATCVKLEIPADCKQDFLIRLRSMNITANSLFPGMDGLGRSVYELLSVHQ